MTNLFQNSISKTNLLNITKSLDLPKVEFSNSEIKIGMEVYLLGINEFGSIIKKHSSITAIRSISEHSPMGNFFQETNIDIIQVGSHNRDFSGVVIDKIGKLFALWSIFAFKEDQEFEFFYGGISSYYLNEIIKLAKEEKLFRWIEAEFHPVTLPELKRNNLPNHWIKKLT